jgi:bacteriochlorophyll 4-vinyl reductase
MEPIPKSGYYYANMFARTALEAYEEVIGKNGLSAILNLAGLGNLIDNYPPDNLERGFDFSDFTAIHIALDEMYGSRGGHGLARRAGQATFNMVLKNFGALAGVGDPVFQALPFHTRIEIGLPAAARIFSQITDQFSTVDATEEAFIWTIHRCPICWTRHGAEMPVCSLSTGLLEALFAWISGGSQVRVSESKCCAMGDTVCEFSIPKIPEPMGS